MALLFAAPRAALRLFLQTAFIAPSPQTRHITQSDFDQRLKEHSGTANVSLDRGGLVRNITKLELGLLVGAILATRIAHAEELAPVTIQGYQYVDYDWASAWAFQYDPIIAGGSGPAGVLSATPSGHTSCTAEIMNQQVDLGFQSQPSDPTDTSLPIPVADANPIDIVNGSPVGYDFGGVNGPNGFMVFPNWADGINAASHSLINYANQSYTIEQLINVWAPPQLNPNAMSNTLGDLGMTESMAGATYLSDLTGSQVIQFIAAFAWQEGFKLQGC